MAGRVAVTNTSPIIALCCIGELRLLTAVFEQVVIPFEVWDELVAKDGAAEPASVMAFPQMSFRPAPAFSKRTAGLHHGERAAIALALVIPETWVLLDDVAARRRAQEAGLHVMGTLGILAESKRAGLIPVVRPLVQQLIKSGFRLAPTLVARLLTTLGE